MFTKINLFRGRCRSTNAQDCPISVISRRQPGRLGRSKTRQFEPNTNTPRHIVGCHA